MAVNAFGAFGNTLVNVVQELLQVDAEAARDHPLPDASIWGRSTNRSTNGLLSISGPNATTLQNLQGLLGPLASGAAVVVRGAISGVVWGFFILVFASTSSSDGPVFGRFAALNVPEPWRPELGRLWHEIVRIWNSFVRGQFVVASDHRHRRVVAMGDPRRAERAGAGPDLRCAGVCPRHRPGHRGRARRSIARSFSVHPGCRSPNLWFALVVGFTYFLIQQIREPLPAAAASWAAVSACTRRW